MSSGGGNSGNTKTTTTQQPWSGQQGSLDNLYAQANNLQSGYMPQYFPQSTVSGLTSGQQGDISNLSSLGNYGSSALNAANSGVAGLASQGNSQFQQGQNSAQNALLQQSSGADLSAQNPYFQQMAQTTLANTMPSINASFANGNRSDSGLAARASSEGANDAIGQLAYQNYQTGLQNQLTAAGQESTNYDNANKTTVAAGAVAPTIYGAQLEGGQDAYNADSQTQAQNQAQLTNQVNQWNYNQNLPYNMLGMYDNYISGSYGGSTTQSTPYSSNGTANALGGALGGAATGATIGSAAGPYGTAIGAVGGALAGYFSS